MWWWNHTQNFWNLLPLNHQLADSLETKPTNQTSKMFPGAVDGKKHPHITQRDLSSHCKACGAQGYQVICQWLVPFALWSVHCSYCFWSNHMDFKQLQQFHTFRYKQTVISLWALVSVHRPTELFRSCNIQSDQGAMNDIKLWSNGTIKMPFMNIPVLDIRKCLPDMWKAVACSLQIKPCHSKSRGSVICKYVYRYATSGKFRATTR